MKKYIYMVLAGALLCACTKNIEIIDPYSAGACIGKIDLGVEAGRISVAVETEGDWRLESDQEWLKTDVGGRTGNGAFTVYYESNESDVTALRQTRVAKVAIRLENCMKTDTLVFVQQGFGHSDVDFNVTDDPNVSIEYKAREFSLLTLLCCSSEGEGDVNAWIEGQNADIVVLDGVVSDYDVPGLEVVGCNYKGLGIREKYEQFRRMVESTYNSGLQAGENWIFAGQMYHFSVMQTDCKNTPDWYPTQSGDECFRTDRYAWSNHLYDCVWMKERDYVQTYTDADGRSYCADYVYVTASVLKKIISVELLDVENLSHKAIKITLKY